MYSLHVDGMKIICQAIVWLLDNQYCKSLQACSSYPFTNLAI